MTHRRKPRRPRVVYLDTVRLAKNQATCLTEAERNEVLTPLRKAECALRRGVASEWEWMLVASAMNVAQSIDKMGVVRGLCGHLHNAELALKGIHERAMSTGAWQATSLSYQELEHVTTAVDLHEFQLSHLSYGEYRRVIDRAVAEIRSTGGQVVATSPRQQA
jgi:hypothetical protein